MKLPKRVKVTRTCFIRTLHHIALFAMLHSTFVAPAQGIINAWIHKKGQIIYNNYSGQQAYEETRMQSVSGQSYQNVKGGVKQTYSSSSRSIIPSSATATMFFSDLAEGIIGVSTDKPVDNPFDNIFNITLDRLPKPDERIYLTYELYGVSDHHGIARSVNNRLSAGGHIVKLHQGWSKQKEELDPSWIKNGINTVLFTIPKGAGYQYKVKNLSLQIERGNTMSQLFVLHSQNIVPVKDDKVYVKGFLRGEHEGAKISAANTWLEINDNEFEGFVTLDKFSKENKMLTITALDNNGVLGREILFLDNMTEADITFTIHKKITRKAHYFTSCQKGELALDGASIKISDSAVAKECEISITELRNIDIAPLESGMVNVTKGGKGYRFLPHGTIFKSPVNISIGYDVSLLPTGYTEKDIRTYYFDTNLKQWKQVNKDSLDYEKQVLTSLTTHFSDYINGIIQTPESPETNAFLPTMMSDIKAADPSAEMTLIAPPQASQNGSGNVSYTIKIPAGRKGMQPQVMLQYSNEGGNGWAGQGWNISTPALTIDTRWGVPLFDSTNETEIYSLNGSMLMYPEGYLPHRHYGEVGYNVLNQSRGSSTKQFTPRVQGSYTKIERMGSSPASYYWKVTSTDGTVSWYGGRNAVIENAVMRQAGNTSNIVHWALYMVEDAFGNNIKYIYNSSTISGQSGGQASLNGAKEMYLSQILYTGFSGSDGDYSVTFNNSNDIRPDATFSARLGMKQASAHILENIIVQYQSEKIRKYVLEHSEGRFGKMLLTKITELDGNENKFYHHDFEYYDDVAANGGNLFKNPVNIELPDVDANYSMEFGNIIDASKISSSQSTSKGYSVKPTVGIEVRPWSISGSVRNTFLVGAPFGEQNTKTKGKVSLTDINGDGIDDIIFVTSNGLRYYSGIVDSDNGQLVNQFTSTEKSIHNISDFSYGKNYTKTIFGDSWDISLRSFFAGTQRTRNKSETFTYFTDANNDGLIDIVNKGTVHFNYIDAITGEPTFSTGSEVTPNLVLMGSNPAGEPGLTLEEQEVEPEDPVEFNDDYDVVRVWEAPMSGDISIYNSIVNLPSDQQANISIQKTIQGGSVECELYNSTVTSSGTFYLYTSNSACNTLSSRIWVEKGERLFFRLHKNETGPNPGFSWKIEVFYPFYDLGYEKYDGSFTNVVPATLKYSDTYSFITAADVPVEIPGTGDVSITWPTLTVKHNDETTYRIIKREYTNPSSVTETLVYSKVCTAGVSTSVNTTTLPTNLTGGSNVTYSFEVFSETNSAYSDSTNHFDNPLWRPEIIYSPDASAEDDGASTLETYAVVNYSIYRPADYKGYFNLLSTGNDPLNGSWVSSSGSATYGVKPNITVVNSSILTSSDNGAFIFAVKNADGIVIGKKIVEVTGGVLSVSDSNPVNFFTGNVSSSGYEPDNIRFEYYVTEENKVVFEKFQEAVNRRTAIVGYNWSSTNQNHFNRTVAVSAFYKDHKYLGPMLNGWGHFMYNSSYDSNPSIPSGQFGKLISKAIVDAPFGNINASSSPLLSTGCSQSLPIDQYEECIEDSMGSAIGIPSETTDFETADIDTIIGDLQYEVADFNFDLPFLSLKPNRPVLDQQWDQWLGFYNSQYVGFWKQCAGGMTDPGDGNTSSPSSSGGGGLSYPEFANEDEPDAETADATTGMKAINKIHRSSSRNKSIGFGGHVYSKSRSLYSNTVTDFMDMNGDGYPDILTTETLQKTTMLGGHMPSGGDPDYGNLTKEESVNEGLSLSRSFLIAPGFKMPDIHANQTQFRSMDSPPATFEVNQPSRVNIDINLQGENITRKYWVDLNGDGLSDRVQNTTNGYRFQLNKGQNQFDDNDVEPFSQLSSTLVTPAPHPVGFAEGIIGDINFTTSENLLDFLSTSSFSVGASASARLGYSASASNSESLYADINGDGMADRVEIDHIRFNTGTGFGSSTAITSNGGLFPLTLNADAITKSLAINGSAGAFVGFPICCFLPVLHIKGGFSFDANSSLNIAQTDKLLKDLNGDGYADFLVYDENDPILQDGSIKVYYSAIGRTNMLKKVVNPLGGDFTVDYKANPKTYGNPHSKWVLSEVLVNDGYDKTDDGADTYLKRFEYENARYDRREREFYGFETVKTIDYNIDSTGEPTDIYRTSITLYHNESYFLNGLVKGTIVFKGDDENNRFVASSNIYKLYALETDGTIDLSADVPFTYDAGGTEGRRSAVPLLVSARNHVYELGSNQMYTRTDFEYNSKARITKYIYDGETNTTDDDYYTTIDYHDDSNLLDNNIIGLPMQVKVHNGVSNAIMRVRRTDDIDTATGTIGRIIVTLNGTESAITRMEYDQYGNLVRITLPPNENSEQMVYKYGYDSILNKYIESVEDSYGYVSSTIYDPKLDKILQQKDITSNNTFYEYDTFGRLLKIKAPHEANDPTGYTLTMQYYPFYEDLSGVVEIDEEDFMPVALTNHYDEFNPGNDIQTYTFIDGLARVVQVKKDIEMYLSEEYVEAMSVSGKTEYDVFGRVVKQLHPKYESKDAAINFVINEGTTDRISEVVYDEMDRVVVSSDAQDNLSYTYYSVETGGSIPLHKTRSVTDQNGSQEVITEVFKDANGRVAYTNNVLTGTSPEEIITTFAYNAIGELVSYTDDEGIATSYTYDMAGRKIQMVHPDNGTTNYVYDLASHLIKLQTANLAADTSLDPADRYIKYLYDHNRILEIKFPDVGGAANLSNVIYTYGNSNNETGRVVMQQDATGTQEFQYGSMGEVTLNTRTVVGPSIPTRIFVTSFLYDSWNRIRTIEYPDMEKVDYHYDLGGNLKSIRGDVNGDPYYYVEKIRYDHYEQRTYIKHGNGTENTYTYSPDLRRLENMTAYSSDANKMFDNNYAYDKVGNVLNIKGVAPPNSTNLIGGPYEHGYTYDNLNRLISSEGYYEGDLAQAANNNNYDSDYTNTFIYNSTHGFKTKAQSHQLDGNTVAANTYSNEYGYIAGTHQVYRIDDTGASEYFAYDLNGNMINRYDTNSGNRDFYWDESNRLRVLDEQGKMQHYIYDASGERVLKASTNTESVYENGTLVSTSVTINGYTTYPSGYIVVNSEGEYTKHYYAGSQRVASRIGEESLDIFDESSGRMAMAQEEGAEVKKLDPEKLRQLQIADLGRIMEKAKKGLPKFGESKKEDEETGMQEEEATDATTGHAMRAPEFPLIYFYHPDHLGSSSFVTDGGGMPYQFFVYLPFGEMMAEQHSLTADFDTPHKFNAKELDVETGYYYYGARYYDPRTSIWLSTDPLMEEYPGVNPYVYCVQNPVNLIDPSGMMSERVPVTGDEESQKSFIEQVNEVTGGTYEVINGELRAINGNYGKGVNAGLFEEAIKSEHSFPMEAVTDDDGVFFDSFVSGAVDVGDLSKGPTEARGAIYAHFVKERIAAGERYAEKYKRMEDVKETLVFGMKFSPEFNRYHNFGIDAEIDALSYHTGITRSKFTTRQESIKEGMQPYTQKVIFNYEIQTIQIIIQPGLFGRAKVFGFSNF